MKWSSNHREGFFGESGMATIRLLLGICLLLAVTAIVPFATFSYDGNGQSSLAYDGSRESTADCDAISAFAVGENESGASGCVGFRATFGDSLAAKGGPNIVYRGLTAADAEAIAAGRGLTAKAPGGTWTAA
jgi:hypothetical protein